MKKRRIVKSIYKTIKYNMKSNESGQKAKHADTIIRNHVVWSMGAGMIPVLIADIFAVSALQLDMIRQMCKVYNVDFQETQGKAIVTSLTSTTIARLTAGSVVKLIPGVGSLLGGVTVSMFAGASTYALGEVFKIHFESGGTILDFDPDRLRKYYKEKFEKGKQVARQMKDEGAEVSDDARFEVAKPSGDDAPPQAEAANNATEVEDTEKDVLTKLRELADLKEKGVISQKEFDTMKKKLIDEF